MRNNIKIHIVAGARPNIVKIAPLIRILANEKKIKYKFVYTGQHYNKSLFQEMVKTLDIGMPDVNFKIGSGSPNLQISKIIKKYDEFTESFRPDLVLVFGDVNSTLAASIVAKKKNIKLAHVEAGLRCYDDSLPEEVNRRLTDSISDFLFTPSIFEDKNLKKENIKKNIFFVGNIMIDSLIYFLKKKKEFIPKYKNFNGVITLHRPENVDIKKRLQEIVIEIKKWTKKNRILFPVHPRTKKKLIEFDLLDSLKTIKNLKICPPLNYSSFLLQIINCRFVITDSGGIQEETSYLGIPCFTLRKNTERPITISLGTNQLVNLKAIVNKIEKIERKKVKIDKWDGKTSERILKIIKNI